MPNDGHMMHRGALYVNQDQKPPLSLFWSHRDRLLSLIDSKFLRHDREGIGLGSNFGPT
jgi:hypothetical protein